MGRWASIILLGVAGCASPSFRTVPRMVDGHVENGPLVSPYAYEWFIEGEAAASQGRHDEAAVAFENATAAPTNDALLLSRLAEEYELSGESRRADRTLSVARRNDPGSARVALARGRIAEHRGERDAAFRAFALAKALAPDWDAPVLATANTLVRAGEHERAAAVLFEYAETVPARDSGSVRRALAQLAERNRDAELLERTLALDSMTTPRDGAYAAGRLSLETGQPALAARLLSPPNGSDESLALWLRAAFESGARNEVSEVLRRTRSSRVGGLARHVDLLLESGDADRATELLRSAARTPKNDYARGLVLLDESKYLRAAKMLAKVPHGASTFEESRLALARCSIAQARDGAASETLSRAPYQSLAVREALAHIFLEQGSLSRGLKLFDPKRDEERAVIAALFERAGQFDEAAGYYGAIVARGPMEPGIRARALAERLAARGNLEAAIAVLHRWTERAPADLYARVRLVELLVADYQTEAALARGRRTLALVHEPTLRAHLVEIIADAAVPVD